MDRFNEAYKKRVDRWPYRVDGVVLRPDDEVDTRFWHITRDSIADGSGRGNIILSTLEADFVGPRYPSASGGYECTVVTVVTRWGEQEEPPIVEPGEPRPPDWTPLGHRGIARGRDIVNAHRTWVESVHGTTASSGGRNP